MFRLARCIRTREWIRTLIFSVRICHVCLLRVPPLSRSSSPRRLLPSLESGRSSIATARARLCLENSFWSTNKKHQQLDAISTSLVTAGFRPVLLPTNNNKDNVAPLAAQWTFCAMRRHVDLPTLIAAVADPTTPVVTTVKPCLVKVSGRSSPVDTLLQSLQLYSWLCLWTSLLWW